jgi:type IV secretory pathway VirB2 component (pilin)
MKKNFFKKVTTSATLLALSVQNTVFADDNPFSKTKGDITKVGTEIKTLSYAVAIVCIVAAGLLMMLGDEGKKKGITWLPYVIGGLFVISIAAALVGYMQGLGG